MVAPTDNSVGVICNERRVSVFFGDTCLCPNVLVRPNRLTQRIKIAVLIQKITLGDVCFTLETVDRVNACKVKDDGDKCAANTRLGIPTRSFSGTTGRGG